jgi:predicted RNA methylase
MTLSHLRRAPSPQISNEAYDLGSAAASDILFTADELFRDIRGRRVLDLGCGSGILAIGAALLEAEDVVGIDINIESIKTAIRNASDLGVTVDFVAGDIEAIRGLFDVVVMNPPFGTRRKGNDVIFLTKAMKVSRRVYSLHKSGELNRSFLIKTIERLGGKVDAIFSMRINIPRTYEFHKKERYAVDVDLFRAVSESSTLLAERNAIGQEQGCL